MIGLGWVKKRNLHAFHNECRLKNTLAQFIFYSDVAFYHHNIDWWKKLSLRWYQL